MDLPAGDRRAWILLWVGITLVCTGTFVGLFSGFFGLGQAFAHIEAMPRPTPQDLSGEVHQSVNVSLIGFGIALIGGLFLISAAVQMRFKRREGDDGSTDSFSSDSID